MILGNSCSFTLNYLVYLQNLYLNSLQDFESIARDRAKFPYFDVSSWGLLEGEIFVERFKQSWGEAIDHFATSERKTARELILSDRESDTFRRLFQNDEIGLQGLHKSFESFMAWFEPYPYGGQYILSTITDEEIPVLYHELSDRCGGNLPDRRLNIELVYDEFPIVTAEVRPFYVVIPVAEVLLADDRDKLLAKLQAAIQ